MLYLLYLVDKCGQYAVKRTFSLDDMKSYLTKTANFCTFCIFDRPWDFSIQDTAEEVQLIVHMWIGLFYSRSTARFFHVDSNSTRPCSEENDSLEISSGMVSVPAQSELKANSIGAFPKVKDTQDPSIAKALDLSKKDNSVLDQGSVILDFSLRNSSAETVTSDPQVNRKETSVSGEQNEASETLKRLKSSMGLQEADTLQVCFYSYCYTGERLLPINVFVMIFRWSLGYKII